MNKTIRQRTFGVWSLERKPTQKQISGFETKSGVIVNTIAVGLVCPVTMTAVL